MKNKYLVSIVIFAQLVFAPNLFAINATEVVDNLAGACFAIKSPASNKYVKQYHTGGLINDGESFGFRTTDPEQADQFYFKATRLKHFMLSSQNGRYLASRLLAEPTAGTYPGKFAEWEVQAISWGSSFRYRLKNVGLNRMLRHNYSSNNFYYFDLFNPNNNNSEHEFWLEPRNNCTPHPEMEVNVSGNTDVLKGNVNDPIRGFIDAHTHITSYEFMGGKFMHGFPFHNYGVSEALRNSDGIHGPYGALDLIGNIFAQDDISFRYDTRGWPEFPYWPSVDSLSHGGYYYKWIERAYLGGLRMMVSHMVENKVLCVAQSTINPAAWINPNSCEAMDSVRLQIHRHREMEAYIDAQAGGPGKGFFRIVYSPEEARQVIADGKLAVFLGIEVSELFDCGVQGSCTRHSVEQQLQEVYDLGIRGLFPTHRFDNKLGGSEIEGGFLNVGQALSAGYLFDTQECNDETLGAQLEPGFPLLNGIPIIGDIANGISNAPDYDPNIRHCNQQGLSELGVYLINRMIDMGMLIELDHTSEKTSNSIMDIVEARNYSGVISAHSHLSKAPDGDVHEHFKRLVNVGGYVSPYNYDTNRISDEISNYLDEVEQTNFLTGVGFSTDMSGLADQAPPRADAQANPLAYPFTSEFGLVFNVQKSGNRIMDYNTDGVAHYGLLADHLQDIRERAPARVYESIMNSTEAYLQMWERAQTNTNNYYYNPLDLEVRIVNHRHGNCVDVPGEDDNVGLAVRAQLSSCDHKASDQRWLYDASSGRIANSVDSSLCLDARNTSNGGSVLLRECSDASWTKWNFAGYRLANQANASYSLDAANSSLLSMYSSHGGSNQMWELRPDRDVHVWMTIRTNMGNGCLDVHNADTTNGNYFKLEACHNHPAQQFYYDPATGSVRSGLNSNKCMDLRYADTTNNTPIVIWDCNGSPAQQWDYDNGVLRSRINPNKVVDASSGHHGSRVIIWDFHGGDNQRWRTVLQ